LLTITLSPLLIVAPALASLSAAAAAVVFVSLGVCFAFGFGFGAAVAPTAGDALAANRAAAVAAAVRML